MLRIPEGDFLMADEVRVKLGPGGEDESGPASDEDSVTICGTLSLVVTIDNASSISSIAEEDGFWLDLP
jgi:hypothetical protein